MQAPTKSTPSQDQEPDAQEAAAALEALIERFDAGIFDMGRPRARVRLESDKRVLADVLIEYGQARLRPPGRGRPNAALSAADWAGVAREGGLEAFRSGAVQIRYDLHLGVGFLAATAPPQLPNRLRMHHVRTRMGRISVTEAGSGSPVLAVHGLGATKASLLPTVAALARHHRTIAMDLPGFGDSVKPIGAAYDARFFAHSVRALMDALELERVDLIGNSMGGRVAIECGLTFAERVDRMVLLAPSLAWLRSRPWAPLLRLVPTELGLIQPAPRTVVERIVRTVVPRSEQPWTAAGIDEFLRSYLTPRGRAAFYAAARRIYLEEPYGRDGFWTHLPGLQTPSLFVWGRRDTLVPIGFERYVREAVPRAEHLELDCGHVPQLERPRETHAAIVRFFGAGDTA